MLQYSYNFIRHSKELATAVRYQTQNGKILGSNRAALTISFLRKLSQVIRVNKDIFTFYKYIQCWFIYYN